MSQTLSSLAIITVFSIMGSHLVEMPLFARDFSQASPSQPTASSEQHDQDAIDERHKAMAGRLEQIAQKLQSDTAQEPLQSKKAAGSGLSTRDIMPEAPRVFLEDAEVKKQYAESLREYYSYRVSGYQHRRSVFEWQLFSSKFIFAMVLLLVFLGMYFAALQFHAGLKFLKTGASEKAGLKTEFKASVGSVEVASPVLGVVILSLSLAFFYLYLLFGLSLI